MTGVLEREQEIAALDTLIEGIAAGAGRTLVLEGHPGLGKSTLLAGVMDRPPGAPVRVLRFCCGELERQLAWAGAVGLLAPALRELTPARRQRLIAGPAAAAAALFEPSPPGGAPVRDAAEPDIYAVLAALLALLSEAAGGPDHASVQPLLVVVDDAHWADRGTLSFLAYLQRRLAALPAGLVLATRPPAIADPLQRPLLERIMGAPDTEVVRLRPLTGGAVARLVRSQGFPDADAGFCETCWEVTAGNPFFLHELLLEVRGRGAQTAPAFGSEQLARVTPPAVLRSLLLRLDRLPVSGAAELAGAAAVLGEGATLAQAAALAEIEQVAAIEALDALTSAELLAPGEPLRFVHPLVREAISSEIPPARRARDHARAAEILAAAHAQPEAVALHLLHAPRLADPGTVAALRAGAERARAQGAAPAAVRYLRRALEEPPAPAERAAVLIELARAETASGESDAVTHITEAVKLTSDPRRRAELLFELGWAEHNAGRFPHSAAAFERGLALLEDDSDGAVHDPDLADRLEAGYLVSATLDSDRVVDANARIAAIESEPAEIRSPSHRMLLAQVLFMRTMTGAPHDGIIELAERIWDDGRLLAQEGADSIALWHAIGALSWADAYESSLRAIEATLADAQERGLVLARAQGLYARAWPRLWMGDLRGAQADGWEAIEIWDAGLETYLPGAAYWCGQASLELGEPDRAHAALALCGPLARWEGTGMAGFIHALEGHLHSYHGRLAESVASHRAAGEVMESLMITNPSPMPWRSAAARAMRLLGESDEARALAATELELALHSGAPRAIGVARATLGLCRAGEEGIAELRASAELLAACGARLEEMRALVDLGAALRRAGRPREAREPLRAGLELAQQAGAVVLARRAETELRAAGARGRRLTDGGPGALTASERRVAELAAEGHTNRHIASLLQISVKAVEWHLHQSYRKLDIRGRAQLAGVLTAESTD